MPARSDEADPIPTRVMLADLAGAPQALAKLRGGGSQNALLVPLLEAVATRLTPDAALPTAKALQQRSGLSPAAFKRELAALYQAFLTALETQPDFLTFRHLEHCLVVGGRRKSLSIRCRLPTTPQLGEGIELGFISGATGGDTYYVDRILSEYTEDIITTYVYLKPGYYDPYLWQLRARARFEGKLPFAIEKEMGEFEVQDYLRSLYGQGPKAGTGAPAPLPQRGGQDTRRKRGGQWN
ncbi:hypothetical protein GCM10028822_32690 [Hymenobacter terrigena]